MTTIRQETLAECFHSIMGLANSHYQEIAWKKEYIPLDPDVARYRALEKEGKLLCLVARDEAEKIIGYATFIIYPHLHYRTTLLASNDLIFVPKDKRGSLLGARLLKESEVILKEKGVKVITLHIKTMLNWSPLAVALGYEHVEANYFKWIGESNGI